VEKVWAVELAMVQANSALKMVSLVETHSEHEMELRAE
jgi:hypothetical protein